MVPPTALFLTNHPLVDEHDLSSFKSAIVGAAPMDEVAVKSFKKKFKNFLLLQGMHNYIIMKDQEA